MAGGWWWVIGGWWWVVVGGGWWVVGGGWWVVGSYGSCAIGGVEEGCVVLRPELDNNVYIYQTSAVVCSLS